MHRAVCLLTSQCSLVLIAPTHGAMARLSWPGWLVTYRDGLPACRRSPIQVHCVSEKNVTLFIFCDIFVRFHPILLLFGRNIPPGNLKQAHVHGPHHILFYMFVLYLVKLKTHQNTHRYIGRFPFLLSLNQNLATFYKSLFKLLTF